MPADTPLTTALLQQLTTLDAYAQGITNLAGLEQATNLTTLDLGANRIADISALANRLTQLTHLYLDDNQITDVSPLTGLTNSTAPAVTEESDTGYFTARSTLATESTLGY